MSETTCQICQHPLPETEHTTCTNCINHVRNTLTEIQDLYNELPDHIGHITGISYNPTGSRSSDTHVPGGAPLIMRAGGTTNTPNPARNGSTNHYADILKNDPPSISAALATIEDDWRHHRNDPPAPYPANTHKATTYLTTHITWAARVHPAFTDTTRELRALRQRLEIATGQARHPQESDAPCIECDGTLIQRWTHTGIDPTRECTRCGTTYTTNRYMLAVRDRIETTREQHDRLITASEARILFRLSDKQIYVWERRGKLTHINRDPKGRRLYRIGDIAKLRGRRTTTV